MEYRKIKVNNEEKDVSLLGFGCMRFPMEGNKINEPLAKKMLLKAIDGGVNYIDTAYPYHDGESELFVGKALKDIDRSKYFLADKLPLWDCETEEDIDRIFLEQLEKCQVDYFDFYLIHAVNKARYDKTIKLNVIEHLERFRKEGKIKNIGFSFHDDYDTFVRWVNLYNWDFVQIQLNYMDIDHQQGIKGYELLTEKNIPVVIMEPVKGGSLVNFNDEIIDKFHQLDDTQSIASWAFRWVGTLPNVKVILSGMSTMEHVEDNVKTFSPFTPLNKKELTAIKDIRKHINSLSEVNCTACKYCMPCPHGVDIPGNLRTFNAHAMYGNDHHTKWVISRLKSKDAFADACIECNICLTKCPQNISIPSELKRFKEYALDNGLLE